MTDIAGTCVAVVLIAALAFPAVLSLTPGGASTTPDSLRYFDAAAHIRSGDGLVLTDYRLDAPDPHQPLTTWPPLYPALLALFRVAWPRPEVAAASVNLACLWLAGVLLFFLLKRGLGFRIALLGAMVFVSAQATLTVSAYAFSEPLFLCLLLSAMLLLQPDRETAHRARVRRFGVPLLLATALAGLFYTRYIGFLFAVLVPLAWLLSPRRERRVLPHVFAAAWYGLLCGGLILRNLLLVGDVRGMDDDFGGRLVSKIGPLGNLSDVGCALVSTLPDTFWLWLLVLGVAAAVFVLLFFSRFRHETRRIGSASWRAGRSTCPAIRRLRQTAGQIARPTWDAGEHAGTDPDRVRPLLVTALVVPAVYVIGLIVLRTMTDFIRINIRYVSVLLPSLIVLLALGAASVRRRTRSAEALSIVCVFLLVAFAVEGVRTCVRSVQSLKRIGTPLLELRNGAFFNDYTHAPDRPKLKKVIAGLRKQAGGAIVTEDPGLMLYFEECDPDPGKARQFPNGPITTEIVQAINRAGRDGWLLLLDFDDSFRRLEAYYGVPVDRIPFGDRYLARRLLVAALPLPERLRALPATEK